MNCKHCTVAKVIDDISSYCDNHKCKCKTQHKHCQLKQGINSTEDELLDKIVCTLLKGDMHDT